MARNTVTRRSYKLNSGLNTFVCVCEGIDQELGDRRIRINRGMKRSLMRTRSDHGIRQASALDEMGSPMRKVILCALRLPVKVHRRQDMSLSFEKDYDALYRTINGLCTSLVNRVKLVFVGVIWGVNILPEEEEQVEVSALVLQYLVNVSV